MGSEETDWKLLVIGLSMVGFAMAWSDQHLVHVAAVILGFTSASFLVRFLSRKLCN